MLKIDNALRERLTDERYANAVLKKLRKYKGNKVPQQLYYEGVLLRKMGFRNTDLNNELNRVDLRTTVSNEKPVISLLSKLYKLNIVRSIKEGCVICSLQLLATSVILLPLCYFEPSIITWVLYIICFCVALCKVAMTVTFIIPIFRQEGNSNIILWEDYDLLSRLKHSANVIGRKSGFEDSVNRGTSDPLYYEGLAEIEIEYLGNL